MTPAAPDTERSPSPSADLRAGWARPPEALTPRPSAERLPAELLRRPPRSAQPLKGWRPLGPRRVAVVAGAWLAIAVFGAAIVVYALGPVLAQRDQRNLLRGYRVQVQHASFEAQGLPGVQSIVTAPQIGAAVAVISVGPIGVQQVVVEGAGPVQTERAPGHVAGTAGLGQPGNAAVVARRAAFGRPFGQLQKLRPGDPIVVTTTQGQTLYRVAQVRSLTVTGAPSSQAPAAPGTPPGPAAPATLGPVISAADLYGPSRDNRLTLVTSASSAPWNRTSATVVVARMVTEPFVPTPQQARDTQVDGRSSDRGTTAPVLLAMVAYLAAAGGAVLLYRHAGARVAYLISTGPLVACTVLLGETASRLLPAWT